MMTAMMTMLYAVVQILLHIVYQLMSMTICYLYEPLESHSEACPETYSINVKQSSVTVII
jgi:hypothetical protein